jgi:hypothetical protein
LSYQHVARWTTTAEASWCVLAPIGAWLVPTTKACRTLIHIITSHILLVKSVATSAATAIGAFSVIAVGLPTHARCVTLIVIDAAIPVVVLREAIGAVAAIAAHCVLTAILATVGLGLALVNINASLPCWVQSKEPLAVTCVAIGGSTACAVWTTDIRLHGTHINIYKAKERKAQR